MLIEMSDLVFLKILHWEFCRNSYPQEYGKFLCLVDVFSEQVLSFGFEVGPNGNNCNQVRHDDFR